jgi:hypothetical protein
MAKESGAFEQEDLGIVEASPCFPLLMDLKLPILRRLPSSERILSYAIGGQRRKISQPITFTPFASVQPCSARCLFCSETLLHKESSLLSASLRPLSDYFVGLEEALEALRALPMSFSLSGLESTDQADWLERLLETLQRHEEAGGLVEEKVLYSNAAGLARETTGDRLLPRLAEASLTRMEVSRHHHRQEQNDQIMRFRQGQPIRKQAVFERALQDILAAAIPLRLVCVLQSLGVASVGDLWAYVAWAESLGVRDIVFREFSRLHDEYKENQTYRNIEENRIVLEDLLQEILRLGIPEGSEWVRITAGYYYWNLELKTAQGTRVTFETSDYKEMKKRHRSDVLYKLVYHANGNLCGDWDPKREIIWQASEAGGAGGAGGVAGTPTKAYGCGEKDGQKQQEEKQ